MKLAESYPKWVENTVGNGEIARYEQFLLFPQCFQKACFLEASQGVIVWEWVKEKRPKYLLSTVCFDQKNLKSSQTEHLALYHARKLWTLQNSIKAFADSKCCFYGYFSH